MIENSRVRKVEEKQAHRKEIRKESKRLNETGNVSRKEKARILSEKFGKITESSLRAFEK